MSGSRCPICDRPSPEKISPFCSQRCADLDLGRWFTGRYALPAEWSEDDAPPGMDPEED